MLKSLILLPLLAAASPALAQAAPPARPPLQVPPQLTDPAIADRLGNAMQALSKAFLDVRVGEIQAAIEGRPATPAEQRRTVREIARRVGVSPSLISQIERDKVNPCGATASTCKSRSRRRARRSSRACARCSRRCRR